ncbi:MAG: multifunctional oxoglutarate decarboxylase/oxoglutarate dehydrogenase thiamine pyrophosphate-binding subunit/dihydrolipoyllysine-residue succinyltransferase subunit, partial [Rhodothermales bacterium]
MNTFGFNTGYIEELYAQYLSNPESVSESWREFFADYRPQGIFAPVSAPAAIEESSAPAQVAPPVVAPPTGDGAPVEAPKTPQAPPVEEGAESKVLKGVAARIVENMEASLQIPTATSFRRVAVKLMSENRRLINDYQQYVGGAKVSFTHIIAWALVQAVQAVPEMNSRFGMGDGKPLHVKPAAINLGLAIDIEKSDGSRSLMVPNIKDAASLNFAQFVGLYNDLVRRARDGRLEVSDFEKTTLTLTNPGMIGTMMSVPRLMTGQGLIVAVGSISYPEEFSALSPAELSRLGLSPVMTITSTYDHRVIQGAESGEFLAKTAALLNGEDHFYTRLFSHLKIPNPPLRLAGDSSPLLGRSDAASDMDLIRKQASVIQMIRAYRVRGHLLADINPLGYDIVEHPELDLATYGLTVWDLDREWITGGLGDQDLLTLREILDILWQTYTRHVGTEFMHISSPTEKRWLQERIETVRMRDTLSPKIQRRLLSKLNAAEAFERFLHTKFIGHKRFSLEGSETLIPILDMLLSDAADQGVEEVVMGMAHRGRLNVLANTLGKPYKNIFNEFEGDIDPSTTQGSGDVKYHLGTKGVHEAPSGAKVKMTLASNPSHLEAVDPVVEGMARAKQVLHWDASQTRASNYDKVVPILIHGDAAFAGQGVVAETLNLSQLDGYTTGGTIHIVVNNQIGFTTLPEDARSSLYATDIARMIQAPIFHVNGDDPEAAVRVARLALDYRQVFNKDVVIDMVCYRVHGHNEADEPTFTQPLLYDKIQGHRSVRKLYTEKLLRRGDIDPEQAEKMLDDFQERLQRAFEETKELDSGPPEKKRVRREAPSEMYDAEESIPAVDRTTLDSVAHAIVTAPDDFKIHPKLVRQLDRRRDQYFEKGGVDWAFAEALAFGTLLVGGKRVRLSGQDSRRGTFSQRHAVLVDQETNAEYFPLNHIREGQAPLDTYDSLLSEYAALGFEYGYTVADPDSLVIWEAQFGDFSNGAQIVIDQFISAAEEKWGQVSGLVMLLPHGYEGQGPEHSSARLERFLQLCAEGNIQVCYPTSPSNYFHLLRRQGLRARKKPLVMMAPKSLLRNPMATSEVEAFVSGTFQPVLPAADVEDALCHVICSGKVYYDLMAALRDEGGEGIAVTRLEQFYPYPEEQLRSELERFSSATRVVWLQEEPRNMGGWSFVSPWIERLLTEVRGDDAIPLSYIGRPASASTA